MLKKKLPVPTAHPTLYAHDAPRRVPFSYLLSRRHRSRRRRAPRGGEKNISFFFSSSSFRTARTCDHDAARFDNKRHNS